MAYDLQSALSALAEAGGLGLAVVSVGDPLPEGPGVVRVGVCRDGPLPTSGLEAFDILLSADPAAPAPWVGLAPEALEAALVRLESVVAEQPVAAGVAAQVLRLTLSLPLDQALVVESLAYSMLLASASLKAWRIRTPVKQRGDEDAPRLALSRDGDALHIRLTRPDARNAFDARMRDALVDALEGALADPSAGPVLLTGEGPSFSAGGDLNEFGQATDPGIAHAIRALRSPAALVTRLGARVTVHAHGACVGAGIEVTAAAARGVGAAGASFRLPEVSMGLVPGAGGTATIPRRIGRHRAAYMALTGYPIDLATALAWGLVDEPGP